MGDPGELALVVRAIACGLTNCVTWKAGLVARMSKDRELAGITSKLVVDELRAYIRSGATPEQKNEGRDEYKADFDYWYKANLSIDCLTRPLFVEMVIVDTDADYPIIRIVSVHT